MPRTFSLARLLVAITLFSLFCGLAVNFPIVALICGATVLFFVPTFLVWLVLASYSRHGHAMAFTSFVGAICGLTVGGPLALLVMSPISVNDSPLMQWFKWFVLALIPALGALFLSAALLILGRYVDRHKAHLQRRDY